MRCDREAILPRDNGINRCNTPLGIIEVDPGERGRHFDATDFDEAIGLGCRDVGLGASLLGMTLGGIGHLLADADRKSVVSGKGVSVSVDLGGRRILKKRTNRRTYEPTTLIQSDLDNNYN